MGTPTRKPRAAASRKKSARAQNLARSIGGSGGTVGGNQGFQIVSGMSNGCETPRFNGFAAMRYFQNWAYAAMMLNANAVANVPLRLYARKPKRTEKRAQDREYKSFNDFSREQKNFLMGKGEQKPCRAVQRKVAEFADDLVEVTEPHPALQVLDQPNQRMNGYELTVLQMLDLQITGDSYLLPTSFSELLNVPTEAVRLPPQYVTIRPDLSESKFYEFAGVEPVWFSIDELIQFKMPNPEDVFHGRGWLRAAWNAIALHDAKRQMDLAVFYNMARPDYLINVKSGGTPESREKFKKEIKEGNRGPKKQGNFLMLTGDLGVTPLNWQFPEVGTATRVIEEISAVSGVPVAMLLSNDPTKASSTTARVGWYRNTVRPYCRLHEEKLNQKWLPLFDDAPNTFLCYDPVSFEDAEAQSKRLVGEVAGGVRQVNEARVELGLPWLKDYDIIYPPSGSTGAGASLTGDMAVGQNGPGDNTQQEG